MSGIPNASNNIGMPQRNNYFLSQLDNAIEADQTQKLNLGKQGARFPSGNKDRKSAGSLNKRRVVGPRDISQGSLGSQASATKLSTSPLDPKGR